MEVEVELEAELEAELEVEVVRACASEGWLGRWFGGGDVPSSPTGEGAPAPPPQVPAKPRPYLGMSVMSLSPETRDTLQRHLPFLPNATAGSCVFQVRLRQTSTYFLCFLYIINHTYLLYFALLSSTWTHFYGHIFYFPMSSIHRVSRHVSLLDCTRIY